MSPSFPPGEKNSTLSSEDSPHEASQSGQGSGRESNTDTPRRDHGGGGGASLCDGFTVKDDRLIKVQIAVSYTHLTLLTIYSV